MFRWQARFESGSVDRWTPWCFALVLIVVLFAEAMSRAHSLDAGVDLAAAFQARWLILHGHPADITVTGSHLLAQHFPIAFYPTAWITNVLPVQATLLGVQAASIGLGIVPVWRIARRHANLRVGVTFVLALAYAMSPPLNSLHLADFHPAAVAVAPLLAATYLGLEGRWRWFAVMALLAVAWSAELGLVIAGLGGLFWLQGSPVQGRRAVIAGLAWPLLAVTVFERHFGSTGFIAPDAFAAFGSNLPGVVFGMLLHPGHVLVEVLAEDNLRLVTVLLAPLLFLPLLAPRYLLPALPLQLLYLVADVPKVGNEVGLPITIFAFVAAPFALARMGRIGFERVRVDRRLVTSLLVASLAFFASDAPNSPYRRPWAWARTDSVDASRHLAVSFVGPAAAVRASDSMLPLVANRVHVYAVASEENPASGIIEPASDAFDGARLTADDVEAVLLDRSGDARNPQVLATLDLDLELRGFANVFERDGISLFVRVKNP